MSIVLIILEKMNLSIRVKVRVFSFLLCWGLTTCQPLWVILCRLPEKGRKETEEMVEGMNEGNREKRGTGTNMKKLKK